MDPPPFNHLRNFFDRIKNVGFFERLLSWKSIVSVSYDAFSEFQQMIGVLAEKDRKITEINSKHEALIRDLEYQNQQVTRLTQDLAEERGFVQSVNNKPPKRIRQ